MNLEKIKKNKLEPITKTHTDIILDSVADGVFTVNEDMVITYFNNAAEKICGVDRDMAIGM